MDELQRKFFQLKFRIAFLEKQGQAFEVLFSRIMGHAFADDFIAVRPYGSKGDLKCDGYRASDKTVFQCYAPRTMRLDRLQAKVYEDFNGAVAHWGEDMERWIFVHNDDYGLPADALQQLIDLGKTNPSVSLSDMSYSEIFDITMSLATPQLEDLFGGPAPTQRTLAQLNFEALRPVVMPIKRMKPDENPPRSQTSQSASDIDRVLSAAILQQRQGNIDEAAKEWLAVANIAEEIGDRELGARAHSSVGYLRVEESRLEEAIANYDESLRLNPDSAEAFNNRGIAKNRLRRHEEAIADYDESLRLNPDSAEAFNNRGIAKNDLGRHEEAIADYDESLRLNPDSAEAFNNRGIAKNDLGRHEEAIADYDESLRLNPDSAEAFNNRGFAKNDLRRHEEAIADYDDALRLNPNYAEAFGNRGLTKNVLDRYEEALADFDQAIRLNPKNAATFNNRGNAKNALDRHEEALADFDQAIHLNPGNEVAFNNRGNAKSALGRHEEAIADYDQAIRLKRSFANAYFNRCRANRKLGHLDKSKQDLETAINLISTAGDEVITNWTVDQVYEQLFGGDDS